jgi:pyrimidine operon attenuation protein/uracil phosphoribosyltransferase
MTAPDQPIGEATVLMDSAAIAEAIDRLAQEIAAAHPDLDTVALLGILRRGRPLADRIAARLAAITEQTVRVGSLATTLYRDDLRSGSTVAGVGVGNTHFEFDVHDLTVILVDDVLSTGRTIRAALDEVMDYGRPRTIELACLVDRGLRELPIQPDYCGLATRTRASDHVSVRLDESDGEDAVLLEPGDEGVGNDDRG